MFEHIVTCLVTRDGIWILIGLIEFLKLVTASNYSAVASSCTLQFTTARTKSSQSAVSSPVVAC
jgi:hypothetical protein